MLDFMKGDINELYDENGKLIISESENGI